MLGNLLDVDCCPPQMFCNLLFFWNHKIAADCVIRQAMDIKKTWDDFNKKQTVEWPTSKGHSSLSICDEDEGVQEVGAVVLTTL